MQLRHFLIEYWEEVDIVLEGLKPARRLDVVDFYAVQALLISIVCPVFTTNSHSQHLHVDQSDDVENTR